jgi:hypothetical protein
MKPFALVVIAFRFVAVSVLAFYGYLLVSVLIASMYLPQDHSIDAIIRTSLYLVGGILLYFTAPLLALLVTRGFRDSDSHENS